MSDLAIRVDRLSKLYRIGANEHRHETLMGAITSFLKSPLQNYRNLRKLSRFADVTSEKSQLSASGSHLSSPQDVIWALRDVSFEVKRGEVIGIIGRNGAGKSTLLKILARITEPTSGRAEIHGRVGSLLEVGTGFHPDLTGRENIYLNGTILGMKKREIEERFDEIVEFSGVEKFIDTPVKRYSSGMRVRLAFSVAAHLEPEILLVDEVLAVGDAEFQKKCLCKMEDVANAGRTILFVSHNMEAVLSLCTHGVVVCDGVMVLDGGVQEAVEFYLRGARVQSSSAPSHVIWQTDEIADSRKPVIRRIEMLDLDGHPRTALRTWDAVRFRIHYESREHLEHGSVILDLRDSRNQRLIVLDSGLHVKLRAGLHSVDCVIRQLPLSGGEFVLGAGLAITNSEWLWRNTQVGSILVNGRDVFNIGRAPVTSRMVFAVPHNWDDSDTNARS